jgi:hypothetical protein
MSDAMAIFGYARGTGKECMEYGFTNELAKMVDTLDFTGTNCRHQRYPLRAHGAYKVTGRQALRFTPFCN